MATNTQAEVISRMHAISAHIEKKTEMKEQNFPAIGQEVGSGDQAIMMC